MPPSTARRRSAKGWRRLPGRDGWTLAGSAAARPAQRPPSRERRGPHARTIYEKADLTTSDGHLPWNVLLGGPTAIHPILMSDVPRCARCPSRGFCGVAWDRSHCASSLVVPSPKENQVHGACDDHNKGPPAGTSPSYCSIWMEARPSIYLPTYIEVGVSSTWVFPVYGRGSLPDSKHGAFAWRPPSTGS